MIRMARLVYVNGDSRPLGSCWGFLGIQAALMLQVVR